jgi:hypothetical protein
MERRLGRIQARHPQVNDLFEVTLREIANFSLTIVAPLFPAFRLFSHWESYLFWVLGGDREFHQTFLAERKDHVMPHE